MTANRLSPVNRYALLALVVVLGVSGALILFWFNPEQHSFFPVCPLYRFTGLYCPGCGAQRALHQLAHGHLLLALHFNPLFMLSLPFLAIWGARWLRRLATGKDLQPMLVRPLYIKLVAVLVISFGILRNLPFPPFTCLAPP